MRSLYLALPLLAAFSPAALALDGPLDQADPREIIRACTDGIAAGMDVSRYAEALLAREAPHLSEMARSNGIRCLRTHFDEQFYFLRETNSFVSQEDHIVSQREAQLEELRQAREARAQAEEEARQAREAQAALEAQREAELAENRAEYYRRYYDACYDELRRHAFAALNEPQCVEIFLHNGFNR